MQAPDTQMGLAFPRRVLSYGGGLDSFAMLLDAIERGDKPDLAVFCDVSDGKPEHDPEDPGEWSGTYRHIREVVIPLCRKENIEFVWLDTVRYPVRDAKSLFAWMWARGQIPVAGDDRLCTTIAKVERFETYMNERFPGEHVEVWIGFDAAELRRVEKDPNAGGKKQKRKLRFVRTNRFPLIERNLCRCRCVELVRRLGYPVPRKSACVFCLTGDTEVVTRDGIKAIRCLSGSKHKLLVPRVGKLGGLLHRGAFQEAEVRSFGVQPIWEVKLRRYRSTRIVRTTADHRWFVCSGKQWEPMSSHERKTSTLAQGDRLRTLRACPPVKEHIMPVAVAQGFVFGDGSHPLGEGNERPASVDLHGVKDSALMPFFVGHVFRPIAGKNAVRVYGLPRFWKKLPPLQESRAFLLSWMAGYFAADGSVSVAGQAVIESASRPAIEFFRSAAAVCGVGYTKIQSRMRKGTGTVETPLYRMSLRLADLPSWFFVIPEHARRVSAVQRTKHDQPWVVEDVRPVGIEEEVFCAIVPTAGAFGLSEDLMTGNCPYASLRDWQTLARQAPETFAKIAELEARKPPTSSGKKLSIMGFKTKKDQTGAAIGYRAPALPIYIQGKPRTKREPCSICGAAQKATKETGCDWIETGEAAA